MKVEPETREAGFCTETSVLHELWFHEYDPNILEHRTQFKKALRWFYPNGRKGILTTDHMKRLVLVNVGHKECYEIPDVEKPEVVVIKKEFIRVFLKFSRFMEEEIALRKQRIKNQLYAWHDMFESTRDLDWDNTYVKEQYKELHLFQSCRKSRCEVNDTSLPATKYIAYKITDAGLQEEYEYNKKHSFGGAFVQKPFTFGSSSKKNGSNTAKQGNTSTEGFTFGASTSQKGNTFNFNFNS